MKFKRFFQSIFSVRNRNEHKIISILGFKISFKSEKLIKKKYMQVMETIQKYVGTSTMRKNMVLYFDHSLGGGTDTYFQNQICKLTENDVYVRVQYLLVPQNYKISIYTKEKLGINIANSTEDILYKILNSLQFNTIIINNLVGYPKVKSILNFVKMYKLEFKNVKVIVKGHDFYSICPEWNLLDYDNCYCMGKCTSGKYKKCYKKFRLKCSDIQGTLSIDTWSGIWENFYKDVVDELELFTISAKNEFVNKYPFIESKITINPHKIKPFPKYNIAILGHLAPNKGASIIRDITEYLLLNDITDFNFVLIGANPANIKSEFLCVHGTYSRNIVPQILEYYNIEAIFIPSIGPETFSYTTAEAIALGYPVICFDMGGQADQVKKYPKGKILSSFEPEIIVNEMRGFIEDSSAEVEYASV